jgi:hypothetical protein
MRLILCILPIEAEGDDVGNGSVKLPVYSGHEFFDQTKISEAISLVVQSGNLQEADIIGIQWLSSRQFYLIAKGKPYYGATE